MQAIARKLTTSPTSLSRSESGRSFVQRRVAAFGLVSGSLGGAFLLLRTLSALPPEHRLAWGEPSALFHFVGAACLTAIWLSCRGVPRSLRFIRAAEAAGLIAAAVAYSAMGAAMPAASRPELVVLLSMGLGLVARTVYVPSTARRTLLLCVAVATPALVVHYRALANMDLDAWSAIYPAIVEADLRRLALTGTALQAAWWACVVFLCTAGSKLIYGLRSEARSGRKLGQYTLQAKLGEGGMGQVYRATHAMLRRPTAIKLLTHGRSSQRAIAQFEREVQQTARLTHPNTVTVFDYGRTAAGTFYYAMELVEGITLRELVELHGPQPSARVVHILQQAASALAEAHSAGLIHRDINPANIMLCERGGSQDTVKVLDFGLVKEIAGGSALASVTGVNTVTGTPRYMSPEAIAEPEKVDARSDLYALGAVGYFLLTGRHVFDGESVVEICARHLHATPKSLSEGLGAEVAPDLEALILLCLQKDPFARPQSAVAFCDALRGCREVGTWSAEQAQSWWRREGEAVQAYRARKVVPVRGASSGTIPSGLRSRSSSWSSDAGSTEKESRVSADCRLAGSAGVATCTFQKKPVAGTTRSLARTRDLRRHPTSPRPHKTDAASCIIGGPAYARSGSHSTLRHLNGGQVDGTRRDRP